MDLKGEIMTDREKLIDFMYDCPDCRMLSVSEIQRIADHLISHDVTVREKGEWIAIKTIKYDTITSIWYECSVCGRRIQTIGTPQVCAPFCHCGADMSGVV